MPDRPIPTHVAGRRAVLQGALTGALALTLAGCRLRLGSPPRRAHEGTAPTDADDAAMGTAAAQARQLGQLYDAAAIARPDLRAPLTLLAADHRAHLRVLTALGADATAPTPTPTETSNPASASAAAPTSAPASTSTASSAPPRGPAPTGAATSPPAFPTPTARTATSVLAAAERTVIAARLALTQAAGSDVARLLASLAACGSSHVVLLAGLPAAPKAKAADLPSPGPGRLG